MNNIETLMTLAGVLAGFSIAVFVFRLGREIQMMDADEYAWLPWADWLVIASFLICVLTLLALLILPLPVASVSPYWLVKVAGTGCSLSLVLLAGYVPSICAHYRLLFGSGREGPRVNPEPAELILVLATVAIAAVVAGYYLLAG